MKFDTVIIGAGLAGTAAAIRLAEEGRKVALISGGRSSLHFNSGSLGLLDFDHNGHPVSDPISAAASLPSDHPYAKTGVASLARQADDAAALLRRAGVKTSGTALSNHTRISPLGILTPAWLTLENLVTLDALRALPGKNIAIIGLAGFLDFYPRFIASALTKEGFQCDILTVDTLDLRALRASETEMRAPNIARIMQGESLDRFAQAIHKVTADKRYDAAIVPDVVDFDKDGGAGRLRRAVGTPVFYAPVMGISVPGIAIHERMMRHFTALGGRIFNGHRVISADFDGSHLRAVFTDKLDDDALIADNFILATGSFFGRGLTALPDSVIEPALGLDTVCPADRNAWFSNDLLAPGAIMQAGVITDNLFHPMRNGVAVNNLYAVGAILAGCDSRSEGSGAGVALLSALSVANSILH